MTDPPVFYFMKFHLGLLLVCISPIVADEPPESRYALAETLEISKVPSDFPVGFSLLTTPALQYVAYYDAEHRMTVASRKLDSKDWTYKVLPTQVDWDSHNYVTMSIDSTGHLHVSGNLHTDPLIYFCTSKAGDITTLKAASMSGKLEDRITYPRFFTNSENQLMFTFRNGGSGNGINLYNLYDPKTQTWKRFLDTPLFDGEGKRNAYPVGPSLDTEGFFNVHWVWRDTPDCSTNQHLSYARSRDLVNWESAFGTKIDLPIRFDQSELIVDPIPVGGGIINGGHKMSFDSKNRPLIAYHKSDADGHIQIYVTRPGDKKWEKKVLTEWKDPVIFSGGGSMGFVGVSISEFRKIAPGVFGISYRHKVYGSGMLQIDEATLTHIKNPIRVIPDYPSALGRVESDFTGVEIRRSGDLSRSTDDEVRYILQWETLDANRDKPRDPPLPSPSTLRLHKLILNSETK
jgi:hypothetical protein